MGLGVRLWLRLGFRVGVRVGVQVRVGLGLGLRVRVGVTEERMVAEGAGEHSPISPYISLIAPLHLRTEERVEDEGAEEGGDDEGGHAHALPEIWGRYGGDTREGLGEM